MIGLLGDLAEEVSALATPGSDLFLSVMPDTPNRAAAIMVAGNSGVPPVYAFGPSMGLISHETHQVELRVRGDSWDDDPDTYSATLLWANQLFHGLASTQAGVKTSGVRIMAVTPTSSLIPMPYDAFRRPEFVATLHVMRDSVVPA